MHRLPASPRRGISLLEVVLALGIFLGTFAIIAQIVEQGARAARESLQESAAALRAERVMNELLAGVQPLVNSGPNVFQDDQIWSWSCVVSTGPLSDLLEVTVTVRRDDGSPETAPEWSLTRWSRDPALFSGSSAGAGL